MIKQGILLVALLFVTLANYGQNASLKIGVSDKHTSQIISNKVVKVTIDDSLVHVLTLDKDGWAKLIVQYAGKTKYKVRIDIDQYDSLILKKVGIDFARGRILLVRMTAVKDVSEKKKLNVK